MAIAFLTARSWRRLPLHRSIIEAIRAQSAETLVITPQDLAITFGDEGVKCFHREEPLRARVIFHRIRRTEGSEILYLLDRAGYRLVNPVEGWLCCNHKAMQLAAFEEHGVPHPWTAFTYGSPDRVRGAAKHRIAPEGWVLKPHDGRRGENVHRLDDLSDLEDRWSETRRYRRGFLLQEFIANPPDTPRRHIRVTVVGGRALGATHLVAPEGQWLTNRAQGGRPERYALTPEIQDLAQRAARAVGADYTGVDLIDDREGRFVVLEANEMPVIGRSTRAELARYLVSLDLLESAARAERS